MAQVERRIHSGEQVRTVEEAHHPFGTSAKLGGVTWHAELDDLRLGRPADDLLEMIAQGSGADRLIEHEALAHARQQGIDGLLEVVGSRRVRIVLHCQASISDHPTGAM